MPKSILLNLFNGVAYADLFRAGIIFVLGIVFARLISALVLHIESRFGHHRHRTLLRRTVFYSTFALFTCSALLELGFNLHVLLGAAGILTIALGFASQMSASNLISGLFLVGERAYVTGDTLSVNGVVGEIVSIDLLSIKLRTSDHTYVRIPNEVLIKTQLTNLTHYPIRRLDINLSVSYQEDFEKVRRVLSELARANLLCLKDPAPKVVLQDFADNTLHFRFSLWTGKHHYKELKEMLVEQIKHAFDMHGIISPAPYRILLANSEHHVPTVTMTE